MVILVIVANCLCIIRATNPSRVCVSLTLNNVNFSVCDVCWKYDTYMHGLHCSIDSSTKSYSIQVWEITWTIDNRYHQCWRNFISLDGIGAVCLLWHKPCLVMHLTYTTFHVKLYYSAISRLLILFCYYSIYYVLLTDWLLAGRLALRSIHD